MKANQKFLNNDDDEAVSPVIAVILMVAITVVLAATVYVWVSGFGSSTSSSQKSMALTSAGPIASSIKPYTVAAATSGMKYSDISVSMNGVSYTQDTNNAHCTSPPTSVASNTWIACNGATAQTASSIVGAGDVFALYASSGQTLRVLDTNANAVMLTLVVG